MPRVLTHARIYDNECMPADKLTKGGELEIKKQIIYLLGRFVSLDAIVYATSPCLGKIYEPELPEEIKTQQNTH